MIADALGGDETFCWLILFGLSELKGTLETGLKVLSKGGMDFSVRELLSVDEVSGVMGVSSGGGLLHGDGLLGWVP